MAALYPGTSVSGYNANPPPDDGTHVANNEVDWNADVKSKIGDPLNTFAGAVDSNITSAFGKTLDGATVVSTAVDYPASAADQGRLIKVTVSGKTVTTPDAASVAAPFVFAVNNQSTGSINLAPNSTGGQTIDGGAAALVVQAGGSCVVKTDGTNWFTIGFKPGANSLGGSNYGFGPAVNASLSCSVGSSLLTVALKTKAGNDPSASDPVLIAFRDTTLTTGDPVFVSVTAALSINTNAVGATLASQNSKPFRFWILAFNNAGTAVLALWHSGAGAATTVINPLNEAALASTTGMSAASTSAGVFYTPNGTSLSSKAFRILGYLEYTSGLGTAGTYNAAPDIVQLFGPGIKKPGDTVQAVTTLSTTASTTTSATFANLSADFAATLTPSSATSLVRASAAGLLNQSSTNPAFIQIARVSTLIGGPTQTAASTGSSVPVYLVVLDAPNSASSVTYHVQGKIAGGNTLSFPTNTNAGTLELTEFMA